jgi:hypothetical protein
MWSLFPKHLLNNLPDSLVVSLRKIVAPALREFSFSSSHLEGRQCCAERKSGCKRGSGATIHKNLDGADI